MRPLRSLLPVVALGLGVAKLLAAPPGPTGRGLLAGPASVQLTTDPSGSSPRVGEAVSVGGVVTAVSPHGTFYYVSDPEGGPWSGVKVVGPALERSVGERVTVWGEVSEWFGETRIAARSVRSHGEGTLPPPSEILARDLATDAEKWEGVLVRIHDVTIEGETTRFGEFPFSDDSGYEILADDEFFHSYIAEAGDGFASITGVVAYGFGDFQVEPRDDDDLVGWTSGRGYDAAIAFDVRDESGSPLPSKVTLFPSVGGSLSLGPADRAGGTRDVAYFALGSGTVALPAGTYDVVVSRGIEYGLYEQQVAVGSGETATVDATLRREVDSSGWLSGDFHLHAAPSSDTPLPVPGRVASLAAEGVEWAIATDHNVITDYGPVIERLGLSDWITSSVGQEITTRIFGHFNAWPVELGREPIPWEDVTPDELFSRAHADPGVDIVQVNHPVIPDWGNQYFQIYDVNRLTGLPEEPGFSFDFDVLEVMSGRYIENGIDNLDTWMRMLNNGETITAAGNSDSHHLVYAEPGYPRNFVASSADGPGDASEAELVQAVLDGRTFVSYGPILDFTANGAGPGEVASPVNDEVTLSIGIQCASWLRVDTATIWANGRVLATLPVSDPGPGPQIAHLEWTDRPDQDTWYVLFVDGDDDLAPVRRGADFRPIAFTNPVRVDVDGDGKFTPPGNYAESVTVSEIDEVDGAGVPLRQGEWLSVVGCATTDTRFRDPSTGIFYLDDGTGGIQVREAIGSITEVARGDRVWVGGVVQQSRGESYLGEATVELLPAAGGCPEPIDATTGAIAGAEPWEGRVVRLSGVTYSGSWPAGGAEGAVTLDDGTGAATLLVPPGVVVPPEASSLVDFELTALVTQHDVSSPYTSGYLLTLRDGADLFPDPQPLASPDGMLPPGLSFGSPRPNPFRDRLGLPVYGRARSSEPSVEIFDVTGRRVRSLAVPAGADEVEWDGRDGGGRTVGAGVYFLRLRADDGERVVRVTKVR